jgi:hypothetical protein
MTDLQEEIMSELWRFSRDTRDALAKTRLPSGGWINLWLNIGHYEVTQESAERFGFSSAAVDILRDAAQDPDFYEFSLPSAHAQSPDEVAFMPVGPTRDEAIQKAINAYTQWVLNLFGKVYQALLKNNVRETLYWLGYVLHGIQDLGPHGGITNPEHAALDSQKKSPDDDNNSIQLSRYYTQEFLRHIREVIGKNNFDVLRNWDGDGNLSKSEKEALFGHGWDLSIEAVIEYKKSGKHYIATTPPPVSVRWPRERVFTEILESLATAISDKKFVLVKKTKKLDIEKSKPVFQPLGPAITPQPRAKWTVMVYMAGDDSNPNGIEYAVAQDLRELKDIGSHDAVHFLAQTDECREKNSYRYRLRKGTPLASDRLGVYRGDLNTGRVATLVDFFDWSVCNFPADKYVLVLWGHGSGHDDQDVYRLARGDISPRLAARLAQDRIGFFGRTRRAMLERNGPNKGYGFDSTAADFLDNRELKRAISAVVARIGRPLDLLGFDACLMANTEVAYQLKGLVSWIAASEQTEPGDGWAYRDAFRGLVRKPGQETKTLGKAIVNSFRDAYSKQQTLSLIHVEKIDGLAKNLKKLAQTLKEKDRSVVHSAITKATDLSPDGYEGYRDLGTFLSALKKDANNDVKSAALQCAMSYKQVIQAKTGPGTGLTIYLPDQYNPYIPGSTDALYQLMDFPMECEWSQLLDKVNSPPGWDRATASSFILEHNSFSPRFGGLYGIDRHNVKEILQGILPERKVRHWVDLSRRNIFSDMKGKTTDIIEYLQDDDGPPKVRIFILPGMMGSQLSDRDGHHGLLWFDPVGLAIGSDFPALRLAPDGVHDADSGIKIEAAGPIPLIYDRLAVNLMAAFGPVVDYLAYDWRKPIALNGKTVAERIAKKLKNDGNAPFVLVAHSMGGLVAAKALECLEKTYPAAHRRCKGLIAMGTPWKGSFNGALAMNAQGNTVEQFAHLTKWHTRDIADICQTFWGLSDTLPTDTPELLRPDIYSPGPLSTSPYADSQLSSPLELKVVPPANTLAIVCDLFPTVNNLMPKTSGFEIEEGPGDGTVPLWSATQGGMLESVTVNQKHMALPMDGKTIKAAIDKISFWIAAQPKLLITTGEVDKALKSMPLTRDNFIESLENMDDKPLPLGIFMSMLFLG